jgi:hypothetical protein
MDYLQALAAAATGHSQALPTIGPSTGQGAFANPKVQPALELYASFLRWEIEAFVNSAGEATVSSLLTVQEKSAQRAVVDEIAQIGYNVVANVVRNTSRATLQGIYSELVHKGRVSGEAACHDHLIRLLFFLLGRLCLIYRPATDGSSAHLNIVSEGFECFKKVSLPLFNAKRPVTENLHAFGLDFPQNTDLDGATHGQRIPLDSRLLNAATICRFAGVTIEWSTCIFSHLSFDDSARRLTLFALPSFCLLHKGSQPSLFNM